MYQPLIKEHFSDCIQIYNGSVMIEPAKWAHKKLASAVNDNVYKNTQHTTSFVSSSAKDAADK
jgi:hypothetical protein